MGDINALHEARTAARRYDHAIEEQARSVGLTLGQLDLLLSIKTHPGTPTIGDVAGLLSLRHHSAVELANRAQALGLIARRRDEQDRRIVRLSMTDSGEARLAELARSMPMAVAG